MDDFGYAVYRSVVVVAGYKNSGADDSRCFEGVGRQLRSGLNEAQLTIAARITGETK